LGASNAQGQSISPLPRFCGFVALAICARGSQGYFGQEPGRRRAPGSCLRPPGIPNRRKERL